MTKTVHPRYHVTTAQAAIVRLVKRLQAKGHSIEGLQQCLREVADEYND
jgi:hypothetical protein